MSETPPFYKARTYNWFCVRKWRSRCRKMNFSGVKEDGRVGDYATIAISETTISHVARYDSF